MGARLVAGWVIVALMLVGPLQPLAAAQQSEQETPAQLPTAAPPEVPQAQPPAPAQPDVQAQPPMPLPPFPPPAAMQPPPPPPPMAPPPPPPPVVQTPPPPPPVLVQVNQPPPVRKSRGADIYDVGAGAITVVTLPLKAVICGLSLPLGFTLLAITFGTADRAATAVVREGCGQKWIVRGDDIRPEPPPSQALEWDQPR